MKVLLYELPGATEPEFQAPESLVDVWATESLFVQVTVPPTATVTGLGAYAFVPRLVAPATMATPPGEVGVGVVGVVDVGVEYELPHAGTRTRRESNTHRRANME